MAKTSPEQLAQQQIETALRVARITLDGAEKLVRLQLETAKQSIEDSASTAARLSQVKDVQSALAVRNELTEHAATSLLNLSRNLYELATQAQGEFAQLAQAHVDAQQKLVASGVENLASNSPVGGDAFSSAFKSTIAASQAAFDSLHKASRQVSEFADASLKAASTVATDALTGKGKR